MLFNSLDFLYFFIVVTAVYFLLPYKLRWIHLLIASCFFYMQFVPIYILILSATIVIDYFAGIFIENAPTERKKHFFLVISIVANIGVLVIFKYYNFFINNFNALGGQLPLLNILLPIGLSFHTFQALSYTIEVYRGNYKAERHFGIYALYVMFYPQLVAGPIERPQNMLHQFREKHDFNLVVFFSGLRLMGWGLFKKVVIADRLSVYVDAIYNDPNAYPHYLNVFLAFLFFFIQVYCDFSGYSDMAIGAARSMGFNLMINFNRPFQSKSISEFWRRWHISLSAWFSEYLFTPLSASFRRAGLRGIILAILITFFLSGLWHGAAWGFVVFGLLHGVAIVYEVSTRGIRNRISRHVPARAYNYLCLALTFLYAMFTVVFFRADSMHDAVVMLRHFFSFNTSQAFAMVVTNGATEFGPSSFIIAVGMIMIMLIVERGSEPLLLAFNSTILKDAVFCSLVLVAIIVFGVFQKNSFIYFQF
jgi:alginate O-acetyltransferase complex protein AlgI